MRARSSKLLSGASVLAVMAVLSAAPVKADQTFVGPFLTDPILNADTGSTFINTNASVLADPTDDYSFFNNIGMVGITVDSSYLAGSIHNASAGQITGGVGVIIQNNSQVDGGFWNEGLISSAANAVTIDGATTIDQGFLNDGTISGGPNGVYLGADSDINGGLTNNGLIEGATGINMAGANFELRGGLANSEGATIRGTTTAAISVSGAGAQLKGGITNDGLIQGQGSANGIQLTGGTITGGITNNSTGIIEVTGTTNTAVLINGATFNGNITNSGQILANTPGSYGILATGGAAFNGSIINNQGALIHGGTGGVAVASAFTGDITNSGSIIATTSDAISVWSTTFAGNITNNATGIVDGGSDGISVTGGTFTGNILNDGTIYGRGSSGIWIDVATSFTGNVTNNGYISGAGNGITVGAIGLSGTIVNASTGTIIGGTNGIELDGAVTGGVTTAGTVIGTAGSGIDTTGSTAANTITQTAGLIRGTTNALNLANGGAIDTFNGDGGTLDGNVTGDGADDFIMHASGTFSYLRGTATGLDQFEMQGAGEAVLGAQLRGSATGAGVNVTATSMTLNGGTTYIDDDTVVNTGTYTQTAGILEFQLTSNTAAGNYGTIASGGAVNLGGEIAAYIQGDTFASVGGNTFTYQDVITGAVAGTFTNAGTINTNSIFFTGSALVNAGDVDIVLTRQSFTNALALPALSVNQQTIGAQLEAIYTAGGYGTQFTDLFNYILSLPAGSEAEVARVYDDISGSEHASIQDVGLRVSDGFAEMVGTRLTDLRGTTTTAAAALRRYADATPPAVASDAPSRPGGMRGSMSVWGRGYGTWTNSDGDAEAAGYDQDTGGVAGGMDFAVDDRWNVGGALGISSTDVSFATARDSANVDTFQFAGYGAYNSGRFYTDIVVALGFHDISSSRYIDVTTGAPVVANADYDANSFGVRTEAGMIYDSGRIAFTPFIGLAYGSTSTDGFAESGAGSFGLLVADADADSLSTTVGARFSGAWQAGGVRLVPTAEIAWRHQFLDDNQNFTAAFLEDPATQFQIISAEQARDSIIAKVGMGAQVSKSLVLFLDYNGLYNSSTTTHAASAGLRATW